MTKRINRISLSPVTFNEAYAEALMPAARVFTVDELAVLGTFAVASSIKPEGEGGRVFDLTSRPWLRPLYAETRNKPFQRLVLQKAAQMGLTIHMLYRAMWLCADPERRINTALLFPTQHEVYDLMRSRFRPMVLSSSRLMKLLTGVDSMEVVRIGSSNMRFRGTSTGVGVDSFPADALLVDEVRLQDTARLERTFLRVSDSAIIGPDGERGIIQLASTAGFPGADINFYFERSTQRVWHTTCRTVGCTNSKGFVMAEVWPDCVDPVGMRYICPKCGAEVNPAFGGYQRLGPADAEWEGYGFNQTLKGSSHLPELWRAYQRMVIEGVSPSEFYNSYLGLPHRDPNAVIVTGELFDVAATLEPTYRWPEPGAHREGWFTAMGIDQRGVEKHAVIMRLGGGGRVYLAHLEIIEKSGKEAIDYTAWLARTWAVDVVVCDLMPSYDYSAGLGRALPPGRVWLAEYIPRDQPLTWSDQVEREAIRPSSGEAKYEYLVQIDRYKHLLQAFTLLKNHRVILPNDLTAKLQEVTRDGRRVPVPVALELRKHLENIARVGIPKRRRDPQTGEMIDTGQFEYTFRHLAVDPHFAHAYGYAVAGLMRRMGTTTITGAKEPNVSAPDPHDYAAQLPERLRPRSLAAPFKRECAACSHFRANPEGGLGWCDNPRVAQSLGANPPVRTSSGMTNCRYFRAQGGG